MKREMVTSYDQTGYITIGVFSSVRETLRMMAAMFDWEQVAFNSFTRRMRLHLSRLRSYIRGTCIPSSRSAVSLADVIVT